MDEYRACLYFWINELVEEKYINYAFVHFESEFMEWGNYFEKNGCNFPCFTFIGRKVNATKVQL